MYTFLRAEETWVNEGEDGEIKTHTEKEEA
jgi:hypothetical protein